jgi:serine/threonine-protein kinase RsbT
MSLERFSAPVADEADLTWAIIQVGRLANGIGFKESGKSMVMTAASELGRNILKYARRGTLVAEPVDTDLRKGIEIIVKDHGPGIENVKLAMQDTYSSGGTLGLGLPGVKRMMDEFHIDTAVGRGTIVTIRKWV